MTLYAIRPDPQTGEVPEEDGEVVEQSKYGLSFLEQAITLWRLVGNDQAAGLIEKIIDDASEAAAGGEIRFRKDDVIAMVQALEGVEDAVVASGIVDQQWRVPTERIEDLEELKKKVPAMDLKTDRPLKSKTSALGEVMINAFSVRNFLKFALVNDCVVVYG